MLSLLSASAICVRPSIARANPPQPCTTLQQFRCIFTALGEQYGILSAAPVLVTKSPKTESRSFTIPQPELDQITWLEQPLLPALRTNPVSHLTASASLDALTSVTTRANVPVLLFRRPTSESYLVRLSLDLSVCGTRSIDSSEDIVGLFHTSDIILVRRDLSQIRIPW